MFNKEYNFKGKHAEMVVKLHEDVKLFNRNFDIYLLAPLVGFAYKRKADLDPSTFERTILPDVIMNAKDDLMYNYRLIMLLDDENEPNAEERINKAFKYPETENECADDLALYDSYVRGGLEVLYEKLVLESSDYIGNLHQFLEEYKNRYSYILGWYEL